MAELKEAMDNNYWGKPIGTINPVTGMVDKNVIHEDTKDLDIIIAAVRKILGDDSKHQLRFSKLKE